MASLIMKKNCLKYKQQTARKREVNKRDHNQTKDRRGPEVAETA